MIEARNLSHSLAKRHVLSNVSFRAEPGEHIALIGPNGAGKSTLLQILAGVITPDEGAVLLQEKPSNEVTLDKRARIVSYLPQQRELAWDLLVEDVAALGRFAWGGQRFENMKSSAQAPVRQALKDTGADRYIGRKLSSLSGGEQARVHLARALAGGGKILLLDEPCAALDTRHQLDLMNVLDAARARGTLIISVLHDLELAERFATRLIVLEEGKVMSDAWPLLNSDVLAGTFGLVRRANGGFSKA